MPVEYANPIPSGHCQPGAARLEAWAVANFHLPNVGCYNPLSKLSSGKPSWHVHGEAIDLGCNWNSASARPFGDKWFMWLVAHKDELNLQQAIWGHTIYDIEFGIRAYHHSDHEGHVHAALGHAVAQNWQPPSVAPPVEDDMYSQQDRDRDNKIADQVNWLASIEFPLGWDKRGQSGNTPRTQAMLELVQKILAKP